MKANEVNGRQWFSKLENRILRVGKDDCPRKDKEKEIRKHDQKASNDIADLTIKEVNFMNIMFFKIENRN